jgi:hypothetical protein
VCSVPLGSTSPMPGVRLFQCSPVASQTLCCSVTLIPFVESAEHLSTCEVVEIGEGVTGTVGHVQVVAQCVTAAEKATNVVLDVLGLPDRRG